MYDGAWYRWGAGGHITLIPYTERLKRLALWKLDLLSDESHALLPSTYASCHHYTGATVASFCYLLPIAHRRHACACLYVWLRHAIVGAEPLSLTRLSASTL